MERNVKRENALVSDNYSIKKLVQIPSKFLFASLVDNYIAQTELPGFWVEFRLLNHMFVNNTAA